MDPYILNVIGIIALIYVNFVLFFGLDQYNIDEVIKKLEYAGILLNVEEYMYDLLGVDVKNDNKSGKVTLTQEGLTNKMLITVGMLYVNKKTNPEATMPLVTDADRPPFDGP